MKYYKGDDGRQRFEEHLTSHGGGLNTDAYPANIRDDQAPVELNAVITVDGVVGKRFGYDTLSSGGAAGNPRGLLAYPKLVSGEFEKRLLIFQGGKVYEVTPGSWTWVEVDDYTDNGEPVRGLIHENYAVFGDGVNHNQKYDGSTMANLSTDSPKTNIFGQTNVFLLIASGSNVLWPDPADWTNWATNGGSIAVSGDDGQKVRALAQHSDAVVAFKDRKKRTLSVVFDNDNLEIGLKETEVVDQSGTEATGSVVPIDRGGMLFLAEYGFRTYGTPEGYVQNRSSEGISPFITKIFKKINKAALKAVNAIQRENDILFAVPLGTAAINNRVLLYNLIRNTWTMWDVPVAAFADFEDGTGKRDTYFVHSTAAKLCRFNRMYVDDQGGSNTPILFDRVWKYVVPSQNNILEWVEIECQVTQKQSTEVIISIDGDEMPVTITEEDIMNQSPIPNWIYGGSYFGEGYYGGDEEEDGPKMYRALRKISVSRSVNEGSEIFVRVKNDKLNQGINVRRISLMGYWETPPKP